MRRVFSLNIANCIPRDFIIIYLHHYLYHESAFPLRAGRVTNCFQSHGITRWSSCSPMPIFPGQLDTPLASGRAVPVTPRQGQCPWHGPVVPIGRASARGTAILLRIWPRPTGGQGRWRSRRPNFPIAPRAWLRPGRGGGGWRTPSRWQRARPVYIAQHPVCAAVAPLRMPPSS